jgi:hypothetical protein
VSRYFPSATDDVPWTSERQRLASSSHTPLLVLRWKLAPVLLKAGAFLFGAGVPRIAATFFAVPSWRQGHPFSPKQTLKLSFDIDMIAQTWHSECPSRASHRAGICSFSAPLRRVRDQPFVFPRIISTPQEAFNSCRALFATSGSVQTRL